uniref:SH3 domain-containing protein n=1 Tax=Cairina moschata TaxID=8855 RepID=A0A8C3CLW0_CAIMO
MPPDALGRAAGAEETPRSQSQAAVCSLVPSPQVGAALQQTFQHVLRWGDQLSRAFLGTDSSPETGRPEAGPWDAAAGPGGWWAQLSQASRIYAAPSKEKFPFVWWMKLQTAVEDSSPGQVTRPQTPASEPRGTELSPCGPNTVSARRPSSWLSPSAHVLAMVVKGLAAEKIHAQEQPERNTSSVPQTHREVRALCDHTGAAAGHLSFQKGDILQLLSTVDEDWIRCCHGNSTGLVPVGYTSLIL